MKLTTKLSITFVVLTVIPLALFGYLGYISSRRTIEQDSLDFLSAVNLLKEAEFNRWIESNTRSIRDLARRPLVREYASILVSTAPQEPEYLNAIENLVGIHLLPNLEATGGFLDLSIVQGTDGLILVGTNEHLVGKYRESELFFIEGKADTYVDNPTYEMSLGSTVMHISTPIVDDKGNLIAVLVGHLDLDEMTEIMNMGQELNPSEETYLINKFNAYLTEPRFSSEMGLFRTNHTEGVESCLEHNDGSGYYIDYRGVPDLVVYRWLEEREICIVTEIDQATAFAPIITLRNTLLGFGAVIVLLVSGLGIAFARTLTGPLEIVVRGADEIGEGNLKYRIEIERGDEIGRLAKAFNVMAADLHANQEELVLNERLSALGKLSSGIAHEINNPLAVIDSSVYYLKMQANNEDEKTQLYLERIQEQARKATAIIQSLRNLTKMEEPDKEKLLLSTQIAEGIADIKVPSGIKVIEEIPSEDIYLYADKDQLKMAFRNIAANAIQAMKEKGVLAIGVGVNYDGWIEISFSDSGPGIEPENLDKVFEPFFSTKATGIGFGLAITKMVIEKHGGTIEAQSEHGRGASFIIRLPIVEDPH